jgi:hypothetical protein
MRKLAIILLFISFISYGGQVAVISNTRATKLKGKETMDDLYFNPIKDSLGRWCVSKEEIDQLTDSAYLYLKALPLIQFIPPKDTTFKL